MGDTLLAWALYGDIDLVWAQEERPRLVWSIVGGHRSCLGHSMGDTDSVGTQCGGGAHIFVQSYYIQHCLICRPSDSTVPTDAGIEIGHSTAGHRFVLVLVNITAVHKWAQNTGSVEGAQKSF
jgi:hypothetical protein